MLKRREVVWGQALRLAFLRQYFLCDVGDSGRGGIYQRRKGEDRFALVEMTGDGTPSKRMCEPRWTCGNENTHQKSWRFGCTLGEGGDGQGGPSAWRALNGKPGIRALFGGSEVIHLIRAVV